MFIYVIIEWTLSKRLKNSKKYWIATGWLTRLCEERVRVLGTSTAFIASSATERTTDQVFDTAILDCCLTGRGTGQRAKRGGALRLPSPSPLTHFVQPHAYSLGKFFLAPTLHSYQIQDGGLIQKCALVHPKYVQHFGDMPH